MATIAVSTAAVLIAATVSGHHTPAEVAAITGSAALLAVLASIDVRRRVLPNVIVYPALAIALMVALVRADQSFGGALAGAAIAGSPFLVAFFLIPPRTVSARLGSRPRRSGREGDAKWAGLVGAVGVFLAALVQADQEVGGAVAAGIVVGAPFLRLCMNEHRSRREDEPVVPIRIRGMGGGDVKLAALMGAIAGLSGVVAALSVAVVGGACAAIALLVMRRGGRAIPYGPFLAAGAIVGMV